MLKLLAIALVLVLSPAGPGRPDVMRTLAGQLRATPPV